MNFYISSYLSMVPSLNLVSFWLGKIGYIDHYRCRVYLVTDVQLYLWSIVSNLITLDLNKAKRNPNNEIGIKYIIPLLQLRYTKFLLEVFV